MPKKRLTADEVATSAKLAGVPPALALAIWDQETGGGTNTKTSNRGAVGDFQMMPGTFKQYSPNGNINDPVDNMNAALGYMGSLLKRYNGDWEKVGQAYYHGSALEPGARGPTSGAGTPDTRAYGEQVMARARKYDPMANIATTPASATSTAKGDLLGNPMPAAPVAPKNPGGAPPGPWVDPLWHNLTAQASPNLGGLGPSTPPATYAGPQDQQQMAQGSDEHDMDQFIRGLVDDIV